MARKLKLNLSGLKNQTKTGIITIEYLNGKVDYPIKLKNDREYKNILNLSDYKYKTKLVDDKLVPTTLQKLSQIKPEYRDVIMNSEGYSTKDISYVKIYDENDLIVAKNDRETMIEGITVTAHLDLDYVVDAKENITFLDLINSTFKEIIDEDYQGKPIERGDYYKVTEVLYKANLLSYDVINEFLVNIRALKTGKDVQEERYRLEALNLGLQGSDIDNWIKTRLAQEELEKLENKQTEEDVIVEEVVELEDENKEKIENAEVVVDEKEGDKK